MPKDTETLDRLYLEWSQFTSARTSRETEALALFNFLHMRSGLGHDIHERIMGMIGKLTA